MPKEIDYKKVVEAYSYGKLVAMPTETVYGLAAPINNEVLIKKIFKIKERPFFDPLIVHAARVEDLKMLALEWSPVCEALAQSFWPGPLTLVVKKNECVSDLITSGLDTVGLRIPNSQIALHFLETLGQPVAAPSANLFKRVSPTTPQHVGEVFHPSDVFVLDGGDCEVGIESTIIQVTEKNSVKLLRPGIISIDEIEQVVKEFGYTVTKASSSHVTAPGQMKEHYRPSKPLNTIVANSFDEAKKVANSLTQSDVGLTWLDLPEEATVAARILYGSLRKASLEQSQELALFLNKRLLEDQKWQGIIDRVKKASTVFHIA